jgi:hypothetical protein
MAGLMCPALKKMVHRLLRDAHRRRQPFFGAVHQQVAHRLLRLRVRRVPPLSFELLQRPHAEHVHLKDDVEEDAVHLVPEAL